MAAMKQVQFNEHWQKCIVCGIWFGVDDDFDTNRRKDKNTFYCPNGHNMAFGENEADRLRKQLSQEQQRVSLERQMRMDAENALDKEREAHTRQSKRIHAGVCPCCNRTFQNVARHMATKHHDANPKKVR
jgi:hypothetical protein